MIKKLLCILMASLLVLSNTACQKASPAKPDSSEALTEKETEGSSEERSSSQETSSAPETSSEEPETDPETTGSSETESREETSSQPDKEDGSSKDPGTESQPATSSEESGEVILHLTDGILLKYLVDTEEVYLVVTGSPDSLSPIAPPYQIFDLTGLSKEKEEQLASLKSGQMVQMTYTTSAEGLYPLPVQPLEIVDLDPDSDTPDQNYDFMSLFRSMAELGYIYLIDYDVYPTFLLMKPVSAWQDHPVTYEYSEDGRTLDVVYELKREGAEEPFKFTLASFALLYNGDEPGGDIGYANILLKEDGPDYLYLGLPRYAFDYITGRRDFYFYPEEGNWDNEVKVTLTDEELKTLVYLQTGFDDSVDYDALRKAYSEALEKDDTKAMTEASYPVFTADEWFKEIAFDHVSINGLKPMY